MVRLSSARPEPPPVIRLFLCGDVMIGRGIDQVLAHPCDPALHEGYAHSATDYVRLAEAANGPIPRPADPWYVWGAALDECILVFTDAPTTKIYTLSLHAER